jgi:hypothetical protein
MANLRTRLLSTIMTHNLEVHATYRIKYERRVVAWMVVRSEARRAVASSACLQSCGVKLLDLVNVCAACFSGLVGIEIGEYSVGRLDQRERSKAG